MEFLLEPLELGNEIEDLLTEHMQVVECNEGYLCHLGRITKAA